MAVPHGLLVQKYGGSSMGTVDRINIVADRVMAAHRRGHPLVVVVSAMQGETDRLLGLAGRTQLRRGRASAGPAAQTWPTPEST